MQEKSPTGVYFGRERCGGARIDIEAHKRKRQGLEHIASYLAVELHYT